MCLNISPLAPPTRVVISNGIKCAILSVPTGSDQHCFGFGKCAPLGAEDPTFSMRKTDSHTADGVLRRYINDLPAGFQPSRGRSRAGMSGSAAVAIQRTGRATPALLPEDCRPDAALSIASRLNPFGAALLSAVSRAIVCDAVVNLDNSDSVTCARLNVCEHLVHPGRLYAPFYRRWVSRFLGDAPNGEINFPRLRFLIRTFKFADRTPAIDLSVWMRIRGSATACPSLLPKIPRAMHTAEVLRRGLFNRNSRIFRAVANSVTSETSCQCWGISLKDVENGWADAPQLVSEDDWHKVVIHTRIQD